MIKIPRLRISNVIGQSFSQDSWNLDIQEQKEYRYRLLLRCLMQPIGAPDTRKNCSPEELVKHIKNVFSISDETHSKLINQEQKDKSIILHISKIKAKILKIPDHLDKIDPYCMVSLVTKAYKTTTSTFYTTPTKKALVTPVRSNSLPRTLKCNQDASSSPQQQMSSSVQYNKSRKTCYSQLDVKRTPTLMKTTDPNWTEHFEFYIRDVAEEEVNVFIWDGKKDYESSPKMEKSTGFKSLLKMMKNSFDLGHRTEDLVGFFSIPVRDIPSIGCEQWFPLHTKRKGGAPICGKIHMSMTLRSKQCNENMSEPDGVESDQSSLEDFYHILRILLVDSAKTMKDCQHYDGTLQNVSEVVIRYFCAQNHISCLTLKLLICAILMEWNKSFCCDESNLSVKYGTIHTFCKKILDETKTEADWEVVDNVYKSIDDLLNISQFEIDLFDQAASWFIEDFLSAKESIGISFFSINSNNQVEIQNKLKVIECLVSIDLTSQQMAYKDIIINQLSSKVQRDVYLSLDSMMKNDAGVERDYELSYTQNIIKIVSKCIEVSQDALHNNILFSELQFDYARTLASAIDGKVTQYSKDAISKMEKYLNRYQSYEVNVKDGSKVSLQLYFSLKNLNKILTCIMSSNQHNGNTILATTINKCEVLSLENYAEWFNSHFQYWMLTFRNECLGRTQRAVELDFQPNQVEEGSEISVSCVDAISCFTQVCSEWGRIEFNNVEMNLVAVTKLTDAICDGARSYVRQLLQCAQTIFSSSRCLLEISPQICLIINNMEHVRRYLPSVPESLKWESVVDEISEREDEHKFKVQSLKTLSRLLKCAEKDIRDHLDNMLSKIGHFLSTDIETCLQQWTDPINQTKGVDELLKGLDEKLENLHKNLKSSIFSPLLMELWKLHLQYLDKLVLNGEAPEYAAVIRKNLDIVQCYFTKLGLGEKEITSNYVYQNLSKRLLYNSKSTIDLQLEYCKELSNNVDTPVDYNGHLSVKFGFQQESEGKYVLYIYVLRAINLPGLDHSGYSDPYVSLELLPKPLFSNFSKQKTRVLKETLNPIYNQLFLFPDVPSESFKTDGATLRLSIKDFDKIGSNDFAGEIFLRLNQATDMSKLVSVDFLPALMLPLKRPVETCGSFQTLRDRKKWDKEAKAFVNIRMKVINNQRVRTDTKAPRKPAHGLFIFNQ